MIRVERRKFSGLKIYDCVNFLCKFFTLVAVSMLYHQMAPKTQQHKAAPFCEATQLRDVIQKLSHRISVHSHNELLKY